MNVIVCVKHAVDESELKIDEAGHPRFQNAQMKMSTFDKNAVEEAVRIKEASGGSTAVITLGDPESRKTIKEALAMGLDRGYIVAANPQDYDTLTTSYFLARAIHSIGSFGLIICSEGASDTYDGLVGAMVAEWSNLPYLGYVRKLAINGDSLECEEALEESVEIVRSKVPAVVSVVSEINEARYPTLLQIMQASKKPIDEIRLETLIEGTAPKRSVEIGDIKAQSMKRKGIIFEGGAQESAKKLVEALRAEGALKN